MKETGAGPLEISKANRKRSNGFARLFQRKVNKSLTIIRISERPRKVLRELSKVSSENVV